MGRGSGRRPVAGDPVEAKEARSVIRSGFCFYFAASASISLIISGNALSSSSALRFRLSTTTTGTCTTTLLQGGRRFLGPVPCRGPPHAGLCAGIEDLLGVAVDNLIGPRLILESIEGVKSLPEQL